LFRCIIRLQFNEFSLLRVEVGIEVGVEYGVEVGADFGV